MDSDVARLREDVRRRTLEDRRAYHREYMRQWRKTHPSRPMTAEQRFKDTARSYAGVYKRRGKLVPEPCKCGEVQVQMHHPDYSRPLAVEWLCRPCHLAAHRKEAA